MTIVAIEALTFGLNRLADAAAKRGEQLCLLTRDRSVYSYELSLPQAERIAIVDVDTFDTQSVQSATAEIDTLRGLLNLTDTWSLLAVDLADRLGLAVQNPASVRIARDKYAMRQRLREAGLSRARSVTLDLDTVHDSAHIRNLTFPIVIKDRSGTGSINVWIAHDAQQALRILDDAAAANPHCRKVVLEPFFSGPMFSAESVTWQGHTRVYAIASRILSREPRFREEAMAVPVRLPGAAACDIESWIGKVLDAIGYTHGMSHTEFILTRGGPEVVEINPRAAGGQLTEAVCQAYDYNVLEAYVDMALGQRPALLDADLVMRRGVCAGFVYAEQTGWFERIDGLQRLTQHPGDPLWYPTANNGKRIDHLDDQRASLGLVVAHGETTELAMLNVLSVTGKLVGIMRSDRQGRTRRPSFTGTH